jgi:hypothetical protein
VYTTLDERHPDATVVVPPCVDAVLSATADTPSATATSRRSPGKGEWPGSATAAITNEPASRASSRWKQVIGDGLRFHSDQARATEVAIAAQVLNRMLDRPNSVRVA